MLSSLEGSVALVGAAAAVVQSVFLVVSIGYLNRQFAIVRACSYIERFNSDESIRRRGTVDRWLEVGTQQERLTTFEENQALRADVLGFINLFQELGVAYRRHSVHKATVEENFDFLVPYYWQRTEFVINHLRDARKAPGLYRKFEFMAQELAS